MAVYTNLQRSHPKGPNKKLSGYHRWHQHSRSYLWPPNTHHTRQGNQKEPRAPQDHHKDILAPSYGQTPPKCGASHNFFLCKWKPFPTQKSMKIDFRSFQACNNRWKSETLSELTQVKTKYKYSIFTITDNHGDNEFEHLRIFLAPAHLHTCASNEYIGDVTPYPTRNSQN